jgi:cell division protein FtsL
VAPDDQTPTHISWTAVSTNVIAAVLATAILAMSGGVVYLVWEMPRQQDRIIESQAQIKEALREKGARLERIELNDRVQDERIRQLNGGR